MYKLFGSLLFSFLALPGAFGQEAVGTSTVTLSVGGETPPRNEFGESLGPVFTGNYEYRLRKYWAVEAGVQNMLPSTTHYEFIGVPTGTSILYQQFCCFFVPDRTRVTLLPFGFRGILPVSGGRVELFAGLGGAYAWHSGYSYENAWLLQTSAGGRVALDKQHHFWLGTSGRFFNNFGPNRQQWLSWTADLGLRFGH